MKKIALVCLYLIVSLLVLGTAFCFYDGLKDKAPAEYTDLQEYSILHCGDYGLVSEKLFMVSDYCKNLYGIK